MALSNQEVNKQIQHMVSFIEQEAAEKANEILVKAEEEFNIEKGRIVQQEKLKVMSQYERKEKQVDTQRKIVYSNQLNKSRLQILQARENHVNNLLEEAKKSLADIGNDQGKYGDVLKGLILEACYTLTETTVLVKTREADKALVEKQLDVVKKEYEERTKLSLELKISDEYIPSDSAGGVIVSNGNGRITVDQTLEERLAYIGERTLPAIRTMLYGLSEGRIFFD
ncbi:V-type proton ATPase subunit E [Sphaeroforma arctica JP610]|uniref:V-type proton ATPase subunit E n=1 Tax=Sphaeroforma arctica JP610 TaxID=667725 RepID=A0A0L0G3Z2_9EUKA|nr:V-type proton ATPase subunit E [Sphaeroforma arctica JP610]KNC82948.1 V-type proton ATPase subunit E [Sphaeroforma arctica JP610]|eukprot:XP_014156850.1 V-type proton ATPase subunit E [Sphaeroforma arctica JP610]